jgi:hypothetical protein
LRKKENTLEKPAYLRQDAEPLRLCDFSLRLSYFARKKMTCAKTQSRKGFTLLAFFASFLLYKNKRESRSKALSRKAMVLFAASFLREKKKYLREARLTQARRREAKASLY